MKLNLELISRELGPSVKGSDIRSDCCIPKIEYPMLFNVSDRQFSESIVYITIEKHLVEALETFKRFLDRNSDLVFSCICIGEPPQDFLLRKNCDMIWIDEGVSRTTLFNDVQRIFQTYNSWRSELDIIIANGGTLPDLVNASLTIFKNDLCITDQFSKVLAHRVYKNVLLTKGQLEAIQENEYLPKNMVDDGLEDEQAGESFTSAKPVFSKMRAYDCCVLRSSIPLSADYTVIISLRQNYRDLDNGDCAIMLAFASMVQKLYSTFDIQNNNEGYISAHSTFKALLQGNHVPCADLIRCAATLGWSRETDEFICLCVDALPDKYDQHTHLMRPFASISSRLQAQFGCLAFILDSRIVAVGNLTKARLKEEDFLAKIEIFAKENNLIIGASSSYEGFRSLPGSYRQAFSALRIGYRSDTDVTVLYAFEKYSLEIGMNFIMKEMDPEFYCPKSLVHLARFEPELYVALKEYIESNCNASVASKKLYLQRNSLIYRLEKVKKKTSFDFDDPDTRLLLQISLKLIDLYGLESIMSDTIV